MGQGTEKKEKGSRKFSIFAFTAGRGGKEGSLNSRFIWTETIISLYVAAYPGIVDPGETGLRLVEHKEGGQVGGVGGHDDHGEAGPHHPQDARRKTAGSSWKRKKKTRVLLQIVFLNPFGRLVFTFPNSWVEQDAPGEPDRRGEVEGLLLLGVNVSRHALVEPSGGGEGALFVVVSTLKWRGCGINLTVLLRTLSSNYTKPVEFFFEGLLQWTNNASCDHFKP